MAGAEAIAVTGVDALQACLAAEHAAVYAYGVLGGALAVTDPHSSNTTLAQVSYRSHRSRRDALTLRLAAEGVTPVAAQPAYSIPFPVHTTGAARRLAQLVEGRCAAVYDYAVAQTVQADRDRVADALTDCAVRAVLWGAAPEALPGRPGG